MFGNWTKRQMLGDYQLVNQQTKFDKYDMPTLKEILDAIGHARVFSTWNFEVWVPPHTYQGNGQI
jgi:hypothetical protein